MKSRNRIVIVALLLSALAPTVPSTRARVSATDEQAVALGLSKIQPQNLVGVGSVVGVVNGGNQKIFYSGAVENAPGAPAPTENTLFAIGSITKTMTATLLALYDKRGLVHIPAVPPPGPFNPQAGPRPTLLQQVLPAGYNLPCPRKTITLLDLANHHSGLPRNAKDTDTTVADLYTDLTFCPGCICAGPQCSSCQPPGSYCYSNFGYLILGHALANVAHAQTWAQLNYDQIMKPLGMTDTNVRERYTAAQDFAGRAAKGYMKNMAGAPLYASPQGPGMEDSPAGGLWTTPHDMMQWLIYNMTRPAQPGGAFQPSPPASSIARNELVSLLPALHYPRSTGPDVCAPNTPNVTVGLAWQMVQLTGSNPLSIIEKGGSVAGFRAYIAFDPSTQKGVFVLFNYSVDNVQVVGKTILANLP